MKRTLTVNRLRGHIQTTILCLVCHLFNQSLSGICLHPTPPIFNRQS